MKIYKSGNIFYLSIYFFFALLKPIHFVLARVKQTNIIFRRRYGNVHWVTFIYRDSRWVILPAHFRKRLPTRPNLATYACQGNPGRHLGGSFFSLYMVLSARPCRLGLLPVHSSNGTKRRCSEGQLFCSWLRLARTDEGYCTQPSRRCVPLTQAGGTFAEYWTLFGGLFFSQLGSSCDKDCLP